MNIVVVSGSHRKESNSLRVSELVAREISSISADTQASVLCLAGDPLPLWHEDVWTPDSELNHKWKLFSKPLREADGLVMVTPEWGGMVPPALKNLLLYCSGGIIAHKPALIVSISTGKGGAYPIQELRMSGYKNTFVNYVPDQVIIRHAADFLSDTHREEDDNKRLQERLTYSLDVLLQYANALRPVRDSLDLSKYRNGM